MTSTLTLEEALFVEFLKRENNYTSATVQKSAAGSALTAAKVFEQEQRARDLARQREFENAVAPESTPMSRPSTSFASTMLSSNSFCI